MCTKSIHSNVQKEFYFDTKQQKANALKHKAWKQIIYFKKIIINIHTEDTDERHRQFVQ